MREPQRRFQAFFVGKANYFFTKTFFFVDSLAPYVHFHKENGFPFTRKPWVGTDFLGVSNSSTYSRDPYFMDWVNTCPHGRGDREKIKCLETYIKHLFREQNCVNKTNSIFIFQKKDF